MVRSLKVVGNDMIRALDNSTLERKIIAIFLLQTIDTKCRIALFSMTLPDFSAFIVLFSCSCELVQQLARIQLTKRIVHLLRTFRVKHTTLIKHKINTNS